MPSIEDNLRAWDDPDGWKQHGDEWSSSWGSTPGMWFGSILPRIAPFLPATCLVEIACGHGRVTEQLLRHCDRLIGFDLAPSCVEFCRQRFAEDGGAEFRDTDGRSLPGVADGSVDFAFSWDSLVHAGPEALQAYLGERSRVLRPGRFAFLHHSNFAALREGDEFPENTRWRDTETSADLVRTWARQAGLQCRSQELVQWGAPHCNDAFTVIRRPASGESSDYETLRHTYPDMSAEMSLFRGLDRLYRGEGDV